VCDLDAISYLLMAAEAAQIAIIALLAAAAILNINIFTFFGATPLMVGSLIAAGVAVASLTAALVIANSCTNAACTGFASSLQGLIGCIDRSVFCYRHRNRRVHGARGSAVRRLDRYRRDNRRGRRSDGCMESHQ
jgi:hypothetical protein